jgi:replicative DNA helicase
MGAVHAMPAAVDTPAIANIEAEAALLGAMMFSAKLIDPVVEIVTAEHFYEALHGRIFSAIVREHSAGRAANPITLRPSLEGDEGMAEVGGPAYLATLTAGSLGGIGALDFARQVKDLAYRRATVEGLVDVISQIRDCDEDLAVALAAGETILAEAADDDVDGEEISAGKAAMRVVENMGSQRDYGVLSGIEGLDNVLGALLPEQHLILAGRPGMGKTAVAGGYALGAAKRGHGVLFISLEMSADDLAERMLADLCFDHERGRVPYSVITEGRATTEQARELARAAIRLDELPLEIANLAHATPAKIKRLIRRYKRRFEAKGHKLELVIVDYLQLVSSDQREKDLYTRITEVSKGLKGAAKATKLPIMSLCQLSREVEKRADKRPMLSDLRDSGQIEQDADAVCFLFRPEYYLLAAKPESEELLAQWEIALERVRGVIEFIVAKRRRGRSGTGKGWFHGAYQAVRG